MNYTYFTQYNIRLSSTKQNLQKDRMSKYVTGNSFFIGKFYKSSVLLEGWLSRVR